MKTLQDFKNKLTPGLKIHTMYHLKWVKRDDNGGMICNLVKVLTYTIL